MKKLFKNLIKRLTLFVLAIIIVGGPILYLLSLNSNSVKAAWYDDNWAYRKAITVTVTSSTSDITNLQTLLTVDTSTSMSGKIQSACQDLRFTSVSGKLLPYYIDSGCTGTTSKIWVMADLVPKNTATYTMYMYYGNPTAVVASSTAPFSIPQGLVGYWTMNESSWTNDCSTATVFDYSLNGNHGKACPNSTGPTGGATGQYGNAGSFDGNNDYINAGNSSAFNITGAMTLSAWVKITDNTRTWNIISSKWNDSGSGTDKYTFHFSVHTGKVSLYESTLGSDVGTESVGTTTLSNNIWYHVVAVVNTATDQQKVYLNGVQEGNIVSYTTASMPTVTQNLYIGDKVSTVGTTGMQGSIDDFRIYNRALSDIEISQLYTTPGTVASNNQPSISFASEETTPGPIAYWKFDEGTGTTAQDSTSTNADGTISGATWQTEDQCVAGKCLYFDGSTSNIGVGTTAVSTSSVSIWVKPTSVTTGALIDLDGGTHKITVSSGTVTATGFTSPVYYINGVVKTSPTLTANQWQLLTVTTSASFNATNILIGKSSSTFLTGYLDEIKLYNSARSAAQVLADYNSRGTVTGGAAALGANPQNSSALNQGLVGYWKTDESSGNAADSSGNGLTLTNNGTTTYVAGKFGNGSEHVPASSQYLSTATTISGVKTVSFWVNPDSTTNYYASLTSGAYITSSSGTISATGFTSPAIYVNGVQTTAIAADVWSLVTVVTATGIDADTFYVGRQGSNYFDGTMDEVRVYNRALTQADVTALYTFAPGPVGYWNFDENLGTSANDRSGNANTGTLTNGPTWKQGKYGSGVNFDGTNDYISMASTTTVQNISYWIKPSANAYAVGLSGSKRYFLNNGLYSGTATATRYINGVAATSESLGSELLTNGTFESGVVTPWTTSFSGTGAGTFTTTTTSPYAGTYSLDYNITNGSTVQTDVQAYHNSNFSITSGTLYKVQFATKGSSAISGLQATPRIAGSPYTELGIKYTFDITTSWVLHTYYFYATATQSDAEFFFYVGNHGAFHLYLDNISIKPVSSVGDVTNNAWNFVSVNLDSSISADDIDFGVVNSRYLRGTIDEVRFYNYSRTQKQIVEDMNAGHPAVGGAPVGAPLGHWKFDEGADNTCSGGTNDTCNSGNGGSTLDGAKTGATWTNSGKFGKALTFDGTDDDVNAGDPSNGAFDFGLSDSFTLTAWIKTSGPTGASDAQCIICKDVGSLEKSWWFRTSNANVLQFLLSDGTNEPGVSGSTIVTTGEWIHVAAVRDAVSDTLKVYVDGRQDGSTTDTTTSGSENANPVKIGEFNNGSTRQFNGTIDEPKIYRYALTADEIKVDMNRGSSQVLGSLSDKSTYQPQAANQEYCVPGDSTSCAAPVGEWKFEENIGTSANDTSGNGNTGTWNGTLGSQWKSGKYGSGGKFDGSSNYVDIGDPSSGILDFGTGDFTLSAWIKTSTTGVYQDILDKRTAPNGYLMGVVNTNKFGIFAVGGGNSVSVTGNTTVTDGKWHYVTATFDRDGNASVYLDGVSDATPVSMTTVGTVSTTGKAIIGYRDPALSSVWSYFNGQIDQVRTYNYLLTPAQIAWEYNKGAPVGHWKFDECQGSVANDSSGNSNTGTITVATGNALGTCPTNNSFWGGTGSIFGAGKFNYAPTFDGTDDYISVGSNSILNLSTYTASFWMKATNASDTSAIEQPFTKNTNAATAASNYVFSWRHTSSTFQKACAHSTSGTFGSQAAKITSTMSAGTWYFVTCTYDGTNIKAYLNGNLEATTAAGTPDTGNQPLYIGSGYNNGLTAYFNGQIDDTKIFNYALTATQVKGLYNGGAVRFAPLTGSP